MFTVLLLVALVLFLMGAFTTAKWLLIIALILAIVGLATRSRVP